MAKVRAKVEQESWGDEVVTLRIPWSDKGDNDLVHVVRYARSEKPDTTEWEEFRERPTTGGFNLVAERQLLKGRVLILLMSFPERDATKIDAGFRPALDRCLDTLP